MKTNGTVLVSLPTLISSVISLYYCLELFHPKEYEVEALTELVAANIEIETLSIGK